MQTESILKSVTLEAGERLSIRYTDQRGQILEVTVEAGPDVGNDQGCLSVAGFHLEPGSHFQKLNYALTSRDDDYE